MYLEICILQYVYYNMYLQNVFYNMHIAYYIMYVVKYVDHNM